MVMSGSREEGGRGRFSPTHARTHPHTPPDYTRAHGQGHTHAHSVGCVAPSLGASLCPFPNRVPPSDPPQRVQRHPWGTGGPRVVQEGGEGLWLDQGGQLAEGAGLHDPNGVHVPAGPLRGWERGGPLERPCTAVMLVRCLRVGGESRVFFPGDLWLAYRKKK